VIAVFATSAVPAWFAGATLLAAVPALRAFRTA